MHPFEEYKGTIRYATGGCLDRSASQACRAAPRGGPTVATMPLGAGGGSCLGGMAPALPEEPVTDGALLVAVAIGSDHWVHEGLLQGGAGLAAAQPQLVRQPCSRGTILLLMAGQPGHRP